ncbi:aldo/keto reductase [Membranihabitans maritimus]|uniref:aldo/keto reductase n=1 Tax=Membranihabitans maritimus TaxID=2904244 RepID=UPI001F22BB66|nr:aldo/keto reductase [Membranihabitans maritimus]
MKNLTFLNGDQMPVIGLGTWKSQPGQVFNAVKYAVSAGYRHIDCAAIYGNEKEIGEAISELIRDGVVGREELWITSKLWNDSHRNDQVEDALKNTLVDLQLDYLDLYLIHWPVAIKNGIGFPKSGADFISLKEIPLEETWSAMLKMRDMGIIKHAGVSNFNSKKINHLISVTGAVPEVNQIELHPYLQQTELVDFCKEKNVHVTAYSPLGSADRPTANRDQRPILLENQVVVDIASHKGVSPAQILIAFAVQRGISVIPKSVTPSRIKQNFEAKDITLSPSEMEALYGMDEGMRYIDGTTWTIERSPNTLESLWEGEY